MKTIKFFSIDHTLCLVLFREHFGLYLAVSLEIVSLIKINRALIVNRNRAWSSRIKTHFLVCLSRLKRATDV